MSRSHVKYLLIGGGIASLSAARAIRAQDAAGSILMVAQESMRPYHRARLPALLTRRASEMQDVFAVEPAWFAENHIELRTSARATRLDVPRMSASLDTGDDISFERLLLATGAPPRHLDIQGRTLPNVFYLRNLADADRIFHAIEQIKQHHRGTTESQRRHTRAVPRPRVIIIGGGLFGTEIAAGLSAGKVDVHIVESAEHLWPRFAGEVTGKAVARAIETRHGVNIHLNAQPDRFEGDGRVQRVVLSDGRILACDLVIVAVGSIVSRELLRGTAIACERAILVDRFFQTSIPDIFAAGDCCAVLDPLFGKHRWIDYGEHAVITGRIAGMNMAAADISPLPAAYDRVNHFSSAAFDLKLSGWGEARFVARRLYRGSMGADTGDLIEIGIDADGHIAQILSLNDTADADLLSSAVLQRLNVAGREERLSDPGVSIRRWFTSL